MKKVKGFFPLFFFYIFLFGVADSLRGIIIPETIAEYGINYTLSSLIFTLSGLGYLLGNLFSGLLFHRFGERRIVVFSLFLTSAAVFCVFLTKEFYFLIIVLFFYGYFASTVFAATNQLVHEISTNKASALNFLHLFYAFGAMAAPQYSLLIMGRYEGYRPLFLLPALAFLLLIPFYSAAFRHASAVPDDNSRTAGRAGIASLLIFYIAAFFYVGTEIGISGWVYNYALKGLKLGEASAGLLLTLFFLSLLLGRLTAGIISKKVRPGVCMIVGHILGTSVFICGLFIGPVYLIPISAFFYGGVYPTLISMYNGLLGKNRKPVGIIFAAGAAGSMTLIPVIGYINDRADLFYGMMINGIISIICLVFLLLSSHIYSHYLNKQVKMNKI
ncbi:MFS transporter [bacterium]|nr:MFS transporter [bacterium]